MRPPDFDLARNPAYLWTTTSLVGQVMQLKGEPDSPCERVVEHLSPFAVRSEAGEVLSLAHWQVPAAHHETVSLTMPIGPEAGSAVAIDAMLAPLMEELWALGIVTTKSCQGGRQVETAPHDLWPTVEFEHEGERARVAYPYPVWRRDGYVRFADRASMLKAMRPIRARVLITSIAPTIIRWNQHSYGKSAVG